MIVPEWIYHYERGMSQFDKLNPPSVQNQLNAVLDGLREFYAAILSLNLASTLEELSDLIHTLLRVIVVMFTLYIPTTAKWVVYLKLLDF